MSAELKTHAFPDGEFIIAENALFQIVEPNPGKKLTRNVLNPGFSFSKTLGKEKGLKYNPDTHIGICVQGELRVTMNDANLESKIHPRPATTKVIKAGDAFFVPGDHDVESIGVEPFVAYEFPDCSAMKDFASELTIFNFDEPHSESAKKGKFSVKNLSLDSEHKINLAKINFNAGFHWSKDVSPAVPGNPEHCGKYHFGFCARGAMHITMKDGTKMTISEGQSYVIPAGHDCICDQDTVVYEFDGQTAKEYSSIQGADVTRVQNNPKTSTKDGKPNGTAKHENGKKHNKEVATERGTIGGWISSLF